MKDENTHKIFIQTFFYKSCEELEQLLLVIPTPTALVSSKPSPVIQINLPYIKFIH